jgi:DNA modification methylase
MDLLMCGCKADLLITDPPYNVDYAAPQWVNGMKGKAGKHPKSIKNDNMSPEAFQAFLDAAFERMAENTAPNAAFYVFHSAMAVVHFYGAMLRAGLDVRTQIIWNKAQAGYGFGHYRWKHEPIALAAKAGETPLIYLEAHETVFYALHHGQTPFWQGDKAQTTVWDCGRELANRIHPTQKPVDLLRKPISNSSRPNMLVLDPFGGSGSTLITCESMGRRCCTMEIDPKYAQVVLLRWQEATGKRASVMRHGNPVEVPRD